MITPAPLEITNRLPACIDLKFCEGVRDTINRDPNRRAEVIRKGLLCWVVEHSKPIKITGYSKSKDQAIIIGWEPMEREDGHV